MASDLLRISTNVHPKTKSIIFDVLLIAGRIVRLSDIELIFVSAEAEIRWTAGYIIYAVGRYYAAQCTWCERLLSVASYTYVYWLGDIDITCFFGRPELCM